MLITLPSFFFFPLAQLGESVRVDNNVSSHTHDKAKGEEEEEEERRRKKGEKQTGEKGRALPIEAIPSYNKTTNSAPDGTRMALCASMTTRAFSLSVCFS